MSIDDSVLTEVNITALSGDAFDGGSVCIGADKVCGVDGLEGRAPGVRGSGDPFLGQSRHLPAPLGESVAADVFQADVERVVLLKFFKDGEIRLGFAIGAERFLATVGDEVIPQSRPIGDGLVKRFLDPEERDLGDAFEEADHRVDSETVVAIDQDVDIGEGLVDGVDDIDVAREAGLGRHPLVTASDLDFKLTVSIVVVPATVFEDLVDAGRPFYGVEVIEVNHARVDLGEMRLFGPGHCPDRLIEDDAGEVMEGNVDRVVFFGADTSGRVDQFGDGLALNEFEKLLRFSGLPLSLPPTGRALVGMKDANAQLVWSASVNAFAGIASNLARPRDADGPEFNAFNAVLGERRVGGVREPG